MPQCDIAVVCRLIFRLFAEDAASVLAVGSAVVEIVTTHPAAAFGAGMAQKSAPMFSLEFFPRGRFGIHAELFVKAGAFTDCIVILEAFAPIAF